MRAWEMVQRLEAHTVIAENPSLVPFTNIVPSEK